MLIFSLNQNEEGLKKMLFQLLKEKECIKLGIEKKQDLVVIFRDKQINQLISLEEKIRELTEILMSERKEALYKALIFYVEKPLIEFLLEYTEGNKLRTAKLLGINRNTLEVKIKRAKIEPLRFKR
ncbi:MAG: hypothetical protein NC898_06760 [Candidatus Omnitrophica bacterium]|nr:hypothetical protein [Candidatus Omnitrophota bacterium]MCM8794134.1 hypothetical protein [Candidatus Omnitrophota bacterium]